MDPTVESPSSYYNNYKKRSFFLSRVAVMTSMLVLVITLGINISLLYSHDQNTISSHAATPQNQEKLLPSLPAGCDYRAIKGGEAVFCPNPTPTITATAPINIVLPQLPSQCHIATSTTGSQIQCTSNVPIPTVEVTLPTSCKIANQPNSATCTTATNENVSVPLPSLPAGCSYQLTSGKYYVVCEAK